MSYTLLATHMAVMEVGYVDAHGNPADVYGDVKWSVSDPALAVVDTDVEDSSIVRLTPTGRVGQIQLSATANVDLGKGIKRLTAVYDIEIVASEAVAGVIQPLGDSQPKK